MYELVRVDGSLAESPEQLGTKRKFWYRDSAGRRLLFKAEERGTGEDWAEKIACELCDLVGLPHVLYELAEEYDGSRYVQPGVICENFAPPPLSLVLGNQLLLDRDPAYPVDEARRYKVKQHTVDAISDALQDLALPPAPWVANLPTEVATPIALFAGYLMLDAWIANQDRHHENWAAVRDRDSMWLAPTFDHGASLARNEPEVTRKERLTTKDANRQVPAFAAKAKSAIYANAADKKALGTVEAFLAFATHCPEAAKAWLNRLSAVDQVAQEAILDKVPPKRMTKTTKEFTLELLLENQRRVLDEEIK